MSSLKHWIFGTIVCLCCLAVHGREECEPGKYGDACIRNCSQGCKPFSNNEVRCHKETGKCFDGCKVGVYGDLCDQQCSRNCKNRTCIQQNGHCAFGCIENHIGDFCETSPEITVVNEGTTYSSHTTVTTGVAPTSSSQVVIPVVVTVIVVTVIVLILIIVGAVIIFKRRKRRMERASDPDKVEEGLRPGPPDLDEVEKRLLPGASDPNEVEEGLRPGASDPDEVEERLLPENMSPRDPFSILQAEYEYLKSNLQLNGTKLIDHLFGKKVLTHLQMEDMDVIQGNGRKIEKLVLLLARRPAGDFEVFMEGLEEDQPHIKDYLQTCIMKKAKDVSDKEMADDKKSMDKDHEYNSEDDSTDSDEEKEMAGDQKSMDKDPEYNSEDERTDSDNDGEEDRGQPVKLIKDFERDPREQDVTLHVKVIKVGGVEEKSNKKQFMATVADDTSAVDICVREEKLFDKFKPEYCIILRNVTWKGKVLFTKSSSTATFAAEITVPENIIADALGEGEPVPISEVPTLDNLIRCSLRGKIVKQSPLTKRKCYQKVLSYRQVKLKDDTGSIYVDVWGDIAEQMQLGRVYTVNSCRKRKPRMPLDPWFTTTPKSTVVHLHSSELRHIREDSYQSGTLVGIDVTPYMSCPNPGCFHFQLTDGLCVCCQRQIPDQDQVSYGVAIIDIQTQKGNSHLLTAYWPELSQLFRLFKKKIPPGSDKEKIVKPFKDLMNKTVKYQACGIVSKFKL